MAETRVRVRKAEVLERRCAYPRCRRWFPAEARVYGYRLGHQRGPVYCRTNCRTMDWRRQHG